MGRVTVRRSVATDIAKMYGPELTRRAAVHSVSAVRAKANEAATHSSVADRIEVSVRKVGWHHQIVMSVMGRDARRSLRIWSSAISTGGLSTSMGLVIRERVFRENISCLIR